MWLIFGVFIAGILGETIEKTIILHGNEDLGKVLEEAMPKRCYKDGKDYAEGEAFQGGHLRYRCQKFGVYVIEGCRTDGGKDLDVGDRVLEENLLSQCFKEGNSIFFRQTVCGIIGMPACDKITPHSKRFSLQEIASQAGNLTIKAQGNEKKKKTAAKIFTSTFPTKARARFLHKTLKIETNSIGDDCAKTKIEPTSQKPMSDRFSSALKIAKVTKNPRKSSETQKILNAEVKSKKKLKNSPAKLPVTVSAGIFSDSKKTAENYRNPITKHAKNLREYLLAKGKSRNLENSRQTQKSKSKGKKEERKTRISSKIPISKESTTSKNDLHQKMINKSPKNLKEHKKQFADAPTCATNPQLTRKMRIKKDSPLLGVAGMQEVGSVSRTISTQIGSSSRLDDRPGLPLGWHIVGSQMSNGGIPTQNIHLLSRTFRFPNPLN